MQRILDGVGVGFVPRLQFGWQTTERHTLLTRGSQPRGRQRSTVEDSSTERF